MGMETMVYFNIDGTEICARVSPEAAMAPGERMPLMADMRHMHLIDPESDRVVEAPAVARANGAAKVPA
jgi:multiple sugar transport system ATP-binding protein